MELWYYAEQDPVAGTWAVTECTHQWRTSLDPLGGYDEGRDTEEIGYDLVSRTFHDLTACEAEVERLGAADLTSTLI